MNRLKQLAVGPVRRMARDTRGNTLAIVGGAMFPLIAIVGSGIDLSRTYMAHTRLQQACDAGALAGRRAMTSGTVDDAVRAEALKFFKFNFPTGRDGVDGTAAFTARGFTPVVGSAADATVTVAATTTMPMSIMKIFGFATLPIGVNCKARLDFVNTDVVLVLDTTGSMDAKAVSSDADNKIVALRKAVLSFYDTLAPIQTQLQGVGLRLRYSVVPYASSINMGKVLRNVNTNYVADDDYTYQSRQALYQHKKNGVSQGICDDRSGTIDKSTNPPTCTWYDNDPGGTGGSTDTFWGWQYKKMTYDVSGYAGGNSVDVPSRYPGSYAKATWKGCIEERQTTNAITSSTGSIPTEAYDLDIDKIPDASLATKWRPYWPEVEYQRTYGPELSRSNVPSNQWHLFADDTFLRPQHACPAEAKRLQSWTRTALSTYLNTLQPDGGTYHDNGMVWGIRMLSGSGVFGADNPSTYNGMPVSKYIIFMTDGVFDTGYNTLYTTYGLEQWDARVTPGGTGTDEDEQLARHKNRFGLLCTLAKSRGISVWVVAFAVSLDSSLTKCANKGQASTVADQDELNDKFVEIGKNIGALRLSQ